MSVKIGFSEGIGKNQIKELLSYSKNDSLIKKFTNDPGRFRNLSLFYKWQPGKIIYTLTDGKEKLLGLTWFDRKTNPDAKNAPFTFAIRIYPPIRGKGYSKKLMKWSFDRFMKSDLYRKMENKGFWILTRKDNIFAIKLYEKFGFKKGKIKANYLLMTLANS